MKEINISKDREIVNCDLCGSNNFKLWDKKEPRIVKCNSCDLVYQNDRPVYKVLVVFYRHYQITLKSLVWNLIKRSYH